MAAALGYSGVHAESGDPSTGQGRRHRSRRGTKADDATEPAAQHRHRRQSRRTHHGIAAVSRLVVGAAVDVDALTPLHEARTRAPVTDRSPGRSRASDQPSNLYPSPRTVTRCTGAPGSGLIFARSRLTCTSSVLVSPT